MERIAPSANKSDNVCASDGASIRCHSPLEGGGGVPAAGKETRRSGASVTNPSALTALHNRIGVPDPESWMVVMQSSTTYALESSYSSFPKPLRIDCIAELERDTSAQGFLFALDPLISTFNAACSRLRARHRLSNDKPPSLLRSPVTRARKPTSLPRRRG